MENNSIVDGSSQHMQESGVVLVDKKVFVFLCVYY